MKINCLIVDDEPLAQRVVEKYIEDVSFLELKAKCKNAFEAMQALSEHEVDLMFLDINMPKLSGINFLKTLKNPPLVIITSAYSDFALEGFELDVVDYIKKPFSFERFIKAVSKAQERLKEYKTLPSSPQQINDSVIPDEGHIFVKSNKKSHRIAYDELYYVEALGDYVKFHTIDKVLVTYLSMKSAETVLPISKFIRIHKSFIINISKIKTIEGNEVDIKGNKLPIGSNYKQEFFNRIHSV